MSETRRRTHVNPLEQVVERSRALLPTSLRDFTVSGWRSLMQLHFADHALGRKVHYELWQRRGAVELGLHFESDAPTNDWLYSCYHQRQAEIDAALNADDSLPTVAVERWDKGWTRVHCEYPIGGSYPTAAEVELIAARLAAIIACLHPMLLEIVNE